MNAYIESVIERTRKKYGYEPEFVQTVEEVFSSIEPLVNAHPEYEENDILTRLTEPDRGICFRVTWMDDEGKVRTNTGYRYQFSSAIGPYKGGLRFHPSVYSGIVKFLGFEQIFKNSLTGLPIGGAKGGSDFDPLGKSNAEIMRFCQAFMSELYRHIGPNVDVPAGDIGVGGREIGYMFGQYKRIKDTFENGVLTGKGQSYGGSKHRAEATGFGACYFLEEVLADFGDEIKGKTVAISGFGNVAWGVATKMAEIGAKVVTISGPKGYVYDPDGVSTKEKLDFMLYMRNSNKLDVDAYAEKFGCEFHPGEKPWGEKVDIVMPCATQNEVDMEQAEKIVANGVQYYIEVSNMPTKNDALQFLKKNCKAVAPSKAVNAGGVAVSALEMSQNSMRYAWTRQEVDDKLHDVMSHIHRACVRSAYAYGLGYDLVAGANIAGFEKVAAAMLEQGWI